MCEGILSLEAPAELEGILLLKGTAWPEGILSFEAAAWPEGILSLEAAAWPAGISPILDEVSRRAVMAPRVVAQSAPEDDEEKTALRHQVSSLGGCGKIPVCPWSGKHPTCTRFCGK